MPTHPQTLVLLGASVRAAAWSALRAGIFRPWCVDLFADADLQGACRARAVFGSGYPHGLVVMAREGPAGPWLYTGALENHPAVIEALARERPLWGNSAEVVRRVRSPLLVAAVLSSAGLCCPAVAQSSPAPATRSWLVKQRGSAGGSRIRRWTGQAIGPASYLQEWIDGASCSALYVGHSDGSAQFLGATRQLIGVPWLRSAAFRYGGNIGPLALSPQLQERLQFLGNLLVQSFTLRGYFGVDFILRDDIPWPVEINPRYTAAIEVLERATGARTFLSHAAAFAKLVDSPRDLEASSPLGKPVLCGKAILFARAPLVFPEQGPWSASLGLSWTQGEPPDYADIPHPGCRLEAGQPILTLFTRAGDEAACLEALREKAQALDRHLFA